MNKARLFGTTIEVKAEDIKNGLYSRYEDFVDPEYEFKVQYVNGAKNNGGPYFRLYYSYEQYKKRFPDSAERYKFVANMRHYDESKWHKEWQKKFSSFCEIEKCIKNETTKKWKFADAYYTQNKTCIEIQHSYIAWDFEERNEFYQNLHFKTIWLFDLSNSKVCENEYGNLEILENNANGFFRISEKPENLRENNVYIQVKSKIIYRVNELLRKEISKDDKSTIRYFVPLEIYTEDEFINAIKNEKFAIPLKGKTLQEIWKRDYSWVVVKNLENDDMICINHNNNGEMFRDFKTHCIKYKYLNSRNEYSISHENEKRPIWALIKYKNIN